MKNFNSKIICYFGIIYLQIKLRSTIKYVKNFYNKPMVAEILVQSHVLSLGDRMMLQGPTTGVIEQNICSMQFNDKPIKKADKGKIVGIKLEKKARKNDKVYLIKPAK